MQPRRLVLSRKGFDSGYGGMPSPILPDGRLLPLPIPSAHDPYRFRHFNAAGVALGPLLRDLSGGRHSLRTRINLDPDLDRREDIRPEGWRPALGQAGSAQSHLREQGVGPGDVFLFFGWFRQVERVDGRWRYVPRAPHLHLLHGWLEVEEVLAVVADRERSLRRHPWIASHPHVVSPDHYSDPRNTLYVAPRRSQLVAAGPGGGVFARYAPELRLTAEGATRSVWALPGWFHPGRRRPALSYHADPGRWSRIGERCELRSVPKGQEFVLDLAGRPEGAEWLRGLVAAGGGGQPPAVSRKAPGR